MKRILKPSLTILILLWLSACTQLLVTALNSVELTNIDVQGNRLYLLGEFNSKSRSSVINALDENPQVETIVLTANGGSLDDEVTFALARDIRARKLNTHLLNRSVIASGAVDLFLAGVNRTAERGALLGVHSWSDGSKEGKDIPRGDKAHELNASYIKDMLGSDEFYWFTIYSASADRIHWMSEAEMAQYSLLTQPFAEPSNELTPFGTTFVDERSEILDE